MSGAAMTPCSPVSRAELEERRAFQNGLVEDAQSR